jgi:hypothetical protein
MIVQDSISNTVGIMINNHYGHIWNTGGHNGKN